MIQDIKSGRNGITKVIVYRLDRISRSILDFSNMMDTFSKHGIEFSSATEKFDTGTPMGRAMLNICITFAQLERETTQQRVRDNYISRSRKGFYMGGQIPLGFRKKEITIDKIKTSTYEQVFEEAQLIQKVFEMYADVNISCEDIAKAIRDMPEAARRGRTITRARIQDIIKNPCYVKADLAIYDFFKTHGAKLIDPPENFTGTNGCYLYTGDGVTSKQTDLSNAVVVIAPHEGFINPDLWIRCRERSLAGKQTKRDPKAKNSWLAGLVKCGNCGYALVRKNYVKKNASYFLCSRRMNDNLCCGCGTIRADEFEELIMSKIKEKLRDFQQFEFEKAKQFNPKISELRARQTAIENEINDTVRNVAGASETVMGYINKNIERLHSEKNMIECEIQKLKASGNSSNKKIVCDFEKLESLPFEEKRRLANAVIKKIYATSDRIEIIWNI